MGVRSLLRTNLVRNPNLESDTSTYSNAGLTVSRSDEWSTSGKYSLKQISTGVSNDCFSSIDGDTGGFQSGLQAGKTYTLTGDVYTPFAQTGTLRSYARSIALFYKNSVGTYVAVSSTTGPTTGQARVALTFTIPVDATEAFIRLYNGSPTAGDVTYWDSILVEESPTVGDFFDGSSMETRDRFYKWTGMVGLSTSQEYFVDGTGEGISPGQSLANLKERLMTIILGPNPVRVSEKSLADIKQEALEKLLGDNGLI